MKAILSSLSECLAGVARHWRSLLIPTARVGTPQLPLPNSPTPGHLGLRFHQRFGLLPTQAAGWLLLVRRTDGLHHIALAALLSCAPMLTSAQYALVSDVGGASGGAASTGPYAMTDTTGQPCAGTASSASYTLADGFWNTLASAPAANPNTAATHQGRPQTINATKLLFNDSDADGDTLTLTGISATSAQSGTVILVSGIVTYTPAANFSGTDTFTYTVTDSGGDISTGTVSVTVEASTAVALNRVYGPVMVDGNFVVRFAGIPGYTYTIEFTDSLSPPDWQKADNTTAPTTAGTFGVGVFEFSQSTGGATSRYFRTVHPSY